MGDVETRQEISMEIDFNIDVSTNGDSWLDRNHVLGGGKGIADFLGIYESRRFAKGGSTAKEWHQNAFGMLNRANLADVKCALISLMGNDMINAFMNDGKVTFDETLEALHHTREAIKLLQREETLVMLYAAPPIKVNGFDAQVMVKALNKQIKVACVGLGIDYIESWSVLKSEHFEGASIKNPHCNEAGQKVLADYIRELING